MTLLEKILALLALSVILLVCNQKISHAGDNCTQQCSGKWVNYDSQILCTQLCYNNETNQAILEQIKKLADKYAN